MCAVQKSASSKSDSVPNGIDTQYLEPRSALSEAIAFDTCWALARNRSTAASKPITWGGSSAATVSQLSLQCADVERFLEIGRRGLGNRRLAGEHRGDAVVRHGHMTANLRGAPAVTRREMLGGVEFAVAQFPQQIVMGGVETGEDGGGAVGGHVNLRNSWVVCL